MATAQDPRQIITPDAFSVAPELLGLPLAHPWRRLVAILIDLSLIALLANARGVLFALAAGVFLFWLAFRGRKQTTSSKLARGTLGCLGAFIVFVTVTAIWVSNMVDEDTVLFTTDGPSGEGIAVTVGAVTDFTSLLGAQDTAEAAVAADRIVDRLREQGISSEQMRAVLEEVSEGEDDALVGVIERAISTADTVPVEPVSPMSLDSLLAAYEGARARGDTVELARLGPRLGTRLAAGELANREREIVRLTARNERLSADLGATEQALEAERNRGIIQTIIGFLDEMGLGIGWSGLYFTFMTAFFRGRTAGKRLLGIRVLRLDGKPISYWVAFERFGGYAASLFTGMEGFLRILWDRNRQGLEDKLAETVVIRVTKAGKARITAGAAARSVTAAPWEGGSEVKG
jgi:uncharacterized RDD family membrane protein YckC